MVDTPRRQLILEAVKGRLDAIQSGDGTFATNLGGRVYLYEAAGFGPDDPAYRSAIAISVGDEEIVYQQVKLVMKLPLEIQALVYVDLDEPWVMAEAIVGDIKRAMELEDRRLGGLIKAEMTRGGVRALPREPGSTAVGIGVPYLLTYEEVWGAPEL